MFTPQQLKEQDTSKSLPRSVALILKGYAVISLFLSLLSVLFIFSVISTDGVVEYATHLWETFTGLELEAGVLGSVLLIFTPYYILLTVYFFGLFRLRRWTVAVTVVMAFEILLEFLYDVLVAGNISVSYVLGAMAAVVFLLIVAMLSVRYRTSLLGPGRKLWLQIPIILALLPATIFVGLSVIFVDNKTLDDAHVLTASQPIVADTDNAFLALILEEGMTPAESAALEKASLLYRDFWGEDVINPTELHIVVTDTKRISDAFIVASALPNVQCSVSINDESRDVTKCELNTMRDTAVLLYLRIVDSVTKGDYQDAVTTSIALVNFSHRFEQTSTSMSSIEYLVAAAVRNIGYNAIEYILNEVEKLHNQGLIEQAVVDEIKIAIQSALEKTKPDINTLTNSWRVEYESIKHTPGFPTDVPSNYIWHPNRTLQDYADFIALKIEHQLQVCGSVEEQMLLEKLDAAVAKYSHNQSVYGYLLRPNAIGKILNSVVIPSQNEFKSKYCAVEDRHRELLDLVSSIEQ